MLQKYSILPKIIIPHSSSEEQESLYNCDYSLTNSVQIIFPENLRLWG
jgi:hypothetical protein